MRILKYFIIDFKSWIKSKRIKKIEDKFPGAEYNGKILPKSLGLDQTRYNGYEPCNPSLLKILKQIVVPKNSAIIDIGCGKGFAMFLLSQFSFSRVDGIELSPALALLAQNNLSICGIRDDFFHIFCCNAVNFDDWDHYSHAFLYNPLKEDTLQLIISSISRSLDRYPRQFTVIYFNPVFKSVFETSNIFPFSKNFQRCTIYSTGKIELIHGANTKFFCNIRKAVNLHRFH